MQTPSSHVPPCRDLPARIVKAMIGEQNARLYYLELADMTNDKEDKEAIQHFAEDEAKHFKNFGRLYLHLTGRNPPLPSPEKPVIRNFVDGVRRAFSDEMEAYEFYRDTWLCTGLPLARSIFFEAFTDENEHAMKLNHIFIKTKR